MAPSTFSSPSVRKHSPRSQCWSSNVRKEIEESIQVPRTDVPELGRENAKVMGNVVL